MPSTYATSAYLSPNHWQWPEISTFWQTDASNHYQIKITAIRHIIMLNAAKKVCSLVNSQIDYGNWVFTGLPAYSIFPLPPPPLSVLNAVSLVVLQCRKYDHISDMLRDELHWLSAVCYQLFKLCITVYKMLHNLTPLSTTDKWITWMSVRSGHCLCSADNGKLEVPQTRTIKEQSLFHWPVTVKHFTNVNI